MIMTCIRAFIFIALLLPAAAFGPAFAEDGDSAKNSGWSEDTLKWLTALSSVNYTPDDFGYPPRDDEKRLLQKHRPHVFVGPGGLLPIDFYDFYLPQTVLRDRSNDDVIVIKGPSRKYLKMVERDARYYLDYTGPDLPCKDCTDYKGTAYARVYYETVRFRTGEGIKEEDVTILKYSFAFPQSGLPSRLGLLRGTLARLAGNPDRWHELDIHGAIHIVLNKDRRPMVLLLAQHNHFRSYVFGKDIKANETGRTPVCFAVRSNEPYPCHDGTESKRHRAVGNPAYAAFLVDGRSRPAFSGYDETFSAASGGTEVDYDLKFLPRLDPLYVSWIPLGDRMKVLGVETFYRRGPPGMDFNTHPELRKYSDIMQFWYLRDGSTKDGDVMDESFESFMEVDFERVLLHGGGRLFEDLRRAGFVK